MINHARGELGLKILYAISVGMFIPAVLIAPNSAQILTPLLRELAGKLDAKPQSLQRSLASLKRKRLISTHEKNGETIVVVSVDGKRRLARGNLDKLSIKTPKKWDGKWRLVIFDIPEKQKTAREALRNMLHSLGFLQIQKSCFIHPFECRNEVDVATAFFNITQYLTYIVAESVEGEKAMCTHFRL